MKLTKVFVLVLTILVFSTMAYAADESVELLTLKHNLDLIKMDFLLQQEKAAHAKDRMELLKFQRQATMEEVKRLEVAQKDKAEKEKKDGEEAKKQEQILKDSVGGP